MDEYVLTVITLMLMFYFIFHLVIEEASAEPNKYPSQAQMRSWLSNSEALSKILKRFWDKDSVATLDLQRQKLGDIMDALGMDAKGRDKTR